MAERSGSSAQSGRYGRLLRAGPASLSDKGRKSWPSRTGRKAMSTTDRGMKNDDAE